MEPDFETGMFNPDRTRIYVRGRYFPGIGISRSFGDYQAHTIGVSSEPTVNNFKVQKHNHFLVLASRAVWNVMTPKDVFAFIQNNISLEMGQISKTLATQVRELYKNDDNVLPDLTICIQYFGEAARTLDKGLSAK